MALPRNIDVSQPEEYTVAELWRIRLLAHTADTYRGRVLAKFPEDLRLYQHVIEGAAPDVIVELGSYQGGSAIWFADQLQTFFGAGHVISVDINPVEPVDRSDITFIQGNVTDPVTFDQVADLVGDRSVMVVEDSAHTYPVTLAALNLYSRLVHYGQWFIVEDGVVDEARLRLPGWPTGVQSAIADFCASGQGERFRRNWLTPYGLTCHHGGWLRALA